MMGNTYQEKTTKLQTSMEKQNIADQSWDTQERTSDKITQLMQFQTNNADMHKNKSRGKCRLFDCPKFL